jgi:hypothetical protein
MHEGQFLNVGFLAKHFFGILNSQIKIEWTFSIARLLIAFKALPLVNGQHGLDHYYCEELA